MDIREPLARGPFLVKPSLSAFCVAVTAALGGGGSTDDTVTPGSAEVSGAQDTGPSNLNDGEDVTDRRAGGSGMADTRGDRLLSGEEGRAAGEKDGFDKSKETDEPESKHDGPRQDSLNQGAEKEASAGTQVEQDDNATVTRQACPHPNEDGEGREPSDEEFKPLL